MSFLLARNKRVLAEQHDSFNLKQDMHDAADLFAYTHIIISLQRRRTTS